MAECWQERRFNLAIAHFFVEIRDSLFAGEIIIILLDSEFNGTQ